MKPLKASKYLRGPRSASATEVGSVDSTGSRRRGTQIELHICPECDRDLVFPLAWHEVSMTHWEVALRCPNCDWSHVGRYDQETVDRFDLALDHGSELLTRSLRRLTHGNMSEAAERFSKALALDAIWPIDF